MKKYLFLLYCLSIFLTQAQTLSVENMSLLPLDLAASINQRNDLNGRPCALVKVSLTISGATFGGDVVGNVQRDGSDYWVYLPSGCKMLQIKHPSFKTLMVIFPNYNISGVESKKVYLLDIAQNINDIQPIKAQTNRDASLTNISSHSSLTDEQFNSIDIHNSNTSLFNHKEIQDPYSAFFPLNGINLGKSTYKDAIKLGFRHDDDAFSVKHNLIRIEENKFYTNWTFKDQGIYDYICIEKIPLNWKQEYGFDFSLSYNEWLALFESIGFRIDIINEPKVEEYNGQNVLKAKFRATEPNGEFCFLLNFDWGKDGYSLTSKKTLAFNGLSVVYCQNRQFKSEIDKTKGTSLQLTSPAIGTFFPIYGVTLGKSSWYDVAKAGYPVQPYDPNKKNSKWHADINGINFEDSGYDGIHGSNGYFDKLYMTYSDSMPIEWIKLGFQWGNSYNTWMALLTDLGFNITVKDAPVTIDYDNRKVLKAEISAISKDSHLRIDFNFNYGENGGGVSSPGTLYSISMRAIN